MGNSIFSKGHFSSRRYNRDAVYSVKDTDLITCNFISNVIPINTYNIPKVATLPSINYAIANSRNTIFDYEGKKLLISKKCILLLHSCSDYELYFSDIQAVLFLEVANEDVSSYSEDNHRIYINRKYQDNSIIKAIMKKVKEFIEERNISVIYRELFPKDIVTLPKENLTFRYVNEILGKLRYVPPVVVSEEVEVQPLELVIEPTTSSTNHLTVPYDDLDDFDYEYDEFLSDEYEDNTDSIVEPTPVTSTEIVPVITTEQQSTTEVTTIMSLEEYVNIVINSHEPIKRIHQQVTLLE